MLGKAMRFATVCALAFAICGKASRDNVAAVSKQTTEDLEHRFRQEANFEDHLSTTGGSCSRVRRLAVIFTLSSAMTSAGAFAPQRDIKLHPTDVSQDFADVEAFLKYPTPDDVEAFRSLNKQKNFQSMFRSGDRGPSKMQTPKFNVLEEYTRQAKGKVAEEASKRLSPEQLATLWGLTHTDAHIINQIAKGADSVSFEDYNIDDVADIICTLSKEDMLPWLKVLNAGLDKMPPATPGRLYRGVGWFNAEGSPGSPDSIAPFTGFSSFSKDFHEAECSAGEKKRGIQPTIFVMDTHSSGVQLEEIDDSKEVVFRVGAKFEFVPEEDEKVQREVEELWRKNLASDTLMSDPDFKVVVVREVPTRRWDMVGGWVNIP